MPTTLYVTLHPTPHKGYTDAWENDYNPHGHMEIRSSVLSFEAPPSYADSMPPDSDLESNPLPSYAKSQLPDETLKDMATRIVSAVANSDVYKKLHWQDNWCDDKYDSEIGNFCEQIEKYLKKNTPDSVSITVAGLSASD